MAKTYKNDKGFLIIEMTPDEAITICNFGNGRHLIDDNSGLCLNAEKIVYYVAVLNRVLGINSLKRWINNAKRYKEDIPFETKYYNYYCNVLEINEDDDEDNALKEQVAQIDADNYVNSPEDIESHLV